MDGRRETKSSLPGGDGALIDADTFGEVALRQVVLLSAQ